jgi:hypothetical protein
MFEAMGVREFLLALVMPSFRSSSRIALAINGVTGRG